MQYARVPPGITKRRNVRRAYAGPLYQGGQYYARDILPRPMMGRRATADSESKFFDTALAFTYDLTEEIPATGQLSLIPQGVTESTRVGRKCVVQSISLRGVASFAPATVATASTVITTMIVLDKQANGAAAVLTDIFTGNPQKTYRNLSNSSRFMVLKRWDRVLEPKAGATAAYNTAVQYYNYQKKCNIPLEFSSTTGAITELKSNNIFLVAVSSASAADDLVTFTGSVRLRFSDN